MPLPPTAALLAAALAAAAAPQQADDYYVATWTGLYVLDRASGALQYQLSDQFVSPLYGDVWDTNGTTAPRWVIPDAALSSVSFVDLATGQVTVLTQGGWLGQPVTVAIDPVNVEYYVSDFAADHVIKVDAAGNQSVFLDNASGLLDRTGGLAFGPDGELYVGNYGNGTVVVVDQNGPRLACDGGGITDELGGLVADGSGNLFAADWELDRLYRIRLEDGSIVVHCADPWLDGPNDVKLTRDGHLLTTTFDTQALVEVDLFGTARVINSIPALGGWQGIAVPEDFPYGTGRTFKYGTGLAGSGGFVPDLRGVFSPNIGSTFGLEIRDALGGAGGLLHVGVAPASLPAFGGTLYVAFQPPWIFVRLKHPGSGPGEGDVILPGALPLDPNLVGFDLYCQDLVFDPGAPQGIALSNGLQLAIGQ